ncbi:hypothetical protein HMPREF9081_0784 [Centipeda periodontii DSM 2778]|uniref:Uncharacterized protein n=1 Tax=Centipeda periodontii DSM 2778 TaxID=888060 RepID=F5RKJ9_9FIRM|nr:hypothetical protein HMPREF9081_0784 [Centipeda periodontii DSM 2778]
MLHNLRSTDPCSVHPMDFILAVPMKSVFSENYIKMFSPSFPMENPVL